MSSKTHALQKEECMRTKSNIQEELNQENLENNKKYIIEAPNSTYVPNVILDNAADFDPYEFQILMVICRHTFGWHKERFALSISQLSKLTGIQKGKTIRDRLRKLVDKEIIEKVGKDEYRRDVYRLIVHNPESSSTLGTHGRVPSVPNVKKGPPPLSSLPKNPRSSLSPPQKKNKEILKESQPKKIKYSEYIEMTERDYNKLIKTFGEEKVMIGVEDYDRWKYNNGVERADDYKGVLNWIKRESLKEKRQNEAVEKIKSKNIEFLKSHIKYLENVSAKGNLKYNKEEVYDSVLGFSTSVSGPKMIDNVKKWDQFRKIIK